MTLDLREGAEGKIIVEGAMNEGAKIKIADKKEDGSYCVRVYEIGSAVRRLFGPWWIEAALRGAVPQIPFINVPVNVEKLSQPFVYQEVQTEVNTENAENKQLTTK